MSRSNYSEDGDNWALVRWRGAVKSAIRGKRGQAFLRELGEAMDDMPKKGLIAHHFETEGKYCALGVVGAKRGVDMLRIDEEDIEQTAEAFGISQALVREIEYMNDEYSYYDCTPEKRWRVVRKWVQDNIILESEKSE